MELALGSLFESSARDSDVQLRVSTRALYEADDLAVSWQFPMPVRLSSGCTFSVFQIISYKLNRHPQLLSDTTYMESSLGK